MLRDPEDAPSAGLWAYIDVYDLADSLRLAAESELDTHEVFYIASPDNSANRPLAELIRHHYGDAIEIREPLPRPDASGMSIEKAQRLLGYAPTAPGATTSPRTGRCSTPSASASTRGDTGVQRGRAVG